MAKGYYTTPLCAIVHTNKRIAFLTVLDLGAASATADTCSILLHWPSCADTSCSRTRFTTAEVMGSHGGVPYITKQMLVSAKIPGNTTGVEKVIQSLRPNNFTLEVVDIVLQHIQSAWPPPIPRPTMDEERSDPLPNRSAISAAYCAKEALYWVTYMCPPQLRQAMTTKIGQHLDAIMDWLDILLWYMDPEGGNDGYLFANPTMSCVLLIQLSTRSGPELSKMMFASDKFLEYAVAVWAVQIGGEPWISMSWGKERCAFSALLSAVLNHSEDSRHRVFDTLCKNSRRSRVLRKKIVENAAMRCRDATNMDRDDVEQRLRSQAPPGQSFNAEHISGVDTMLLFLDSVFAIVDVLCEHPLLARRFVKSGFFETFFEALESWLVWKSERMGPDREPRFLGFKLAADAQKTLDRYSRFDWKLSTSAHVAMLQGGLLQVIIEGIQSMPFRDWEHAEGLADCFRRLKELCGSSSQAAELLLPTLKQARPGDFRDDTFLVDQQWALRWNTFCSHIVAGSDLHIYTLNAGGFARPFCDNIECPGTLGLELRTCAGCRSVAYCNNNACQREDWINLHSRECAPADAELQGLKFRGIDYSQRLRNWHILFTSRVGAQSLAGQGVDANAVLRIDSWTPKQTPLQEYEQKNSFLRPRIGGPFTGLREHQTAPRMRALISYMSRAGPNQNFRLVENRIVLGCNTVVILALLCKDDLAGDYRLKLGATRVLPQMN